MGPPSQGERLGGQALRLVEAALQHCLTGPEQWGVPGEVELAELPGSPVVALQAPPEGGQVSLFELVGHEEPAASERHHLVATGLGELDDLGGHGQPFLQVVRPPGRHVVLVEHGGQGGGVVQPPGHGDGRLAELGARFRMGRGLERLGQPGEHAGPERAVGLAQHGEGLLEEADLQVVDGTGRELGPEAEGGPGEPRPVAHPPRQLGRPLVLHASLAGLARGHPGPGEGQPQVAPLGVVAARLEVQCPQRPLVVAGGLLVGEHLHRPVASLPGIGDRLPGLPRTGRLGEVVGQLGQVALEVVAAELDQGRPDPVVEAPPLPGGELLVQGLVDERVGEPEPARSPLQLGHEPRVHGLLEGVEDDARRHAGDPGDHIQVEVASLDRCRGQARVGGLREPVEPPADHMAYPFGNTRSLEPARLQAMLGGQQADQLADEVGIALGLVVDGGDEVGRRIGPGHPGDEAADVAAVEAGQRQVHGCRLPEQLGQGAAQRMPPIDLHVAVGADDQQARVGQLPGDKAEQQQARPVGPVQVVEDEDQPTTRGRRVQAGGHGVEQAEPGHLGIQLGGRPWRPLQVGQLGQELPQLGHLPSQLGGDLRRWAAGGIRAQRLTPGPVGGCARPFAAAPPRHPGLPRACLGAQLLGDAGLADPGLAGDERQPALAAEGAVEGGAELGSFGAPADQGDPVGVLGALGQDRRGSGQVGMHDREDVLGSREAPEKVRSDVDQGGPFRKLVDHQLGRRPGQQDLAAPTQRPQPGRPVEGRPEVVAVAQLGLPGVERGPGRQGDRLWPARWEEGPLQAQGRGHGVACPEEHRQGRVSLTLPLDEPAGVGGDRAGDQRLMPREGGTHGGAVTLPQGCGPLDVGEQEGQDTLRELGRHAPLAGPVPGVGPATHGPS
jgi:hypothetical protein